MTPGSLGHLSRPNKVSVDPRKPRGISKLQDSKDPKISKGSLKLAPEESQSSLLITFVQLLHLSWSGTQKWADCGLSGRVSDQKLDHIRGASARGEVRCNQQILSATFSPNSVRTEPTFSNLPSVYLLSVYFNRSCVGAAVLN